MEFLISISVCERIRLCKALTALVAGAGEALWAKEVTGGSDCGAAQSLEWSRVGSAGLMQGQVSH